MRPGKLNISDEKAALMGALEELEIKGLGKGHNSSSNSSSNHLFLSQDQVPNLGDLVVFGTLRGLEGLPIHSEILQDRTRPLSEWYERMEAQVSSSSSK